MKDLPLICTYLPLRYICLSFIPKISHLCKIILACKTVNLVKIFIALCSKIILSIDTVYAGSLVIITGGLQKTKQTSIRILSLIGDHRHSETIDNVYVPNGLETPVKLFTYPS